MTQRADWLPDRPFTEAEDTGFVAISASYGAEMPTIRETIARNLPGTVTLIVYVRDADEASKVEQDLNPLPSGRLQFLMVPEQPNSATVWARDSLPYPVHLKGSGQSLAPQMGLVDSIYPMHFEPDAAVAKALSLDMTDTGLEFRGGNLLADPDGNCFAEEINEVASLPDAEGLLRQKFGCTSVTLLPPEGGIGDIDERIKFLPGKTALTDSTAYASLLQQRGYAVTMIPAARYNNETYLNALYVNGTIFVPQFDEPTYDAAAIAAYTQLGMTVIGITSKQLAGANGNIHCVTMNYPPGTFTPSPRGVAFVQFR